MDFITVSPNVPAPQRNALPSVPNAWQAPYTAATGNFSMPQDGFRTGMGVPAQTPVLFGNKNTAQLRRMAFRGGFESWFKKDGMSLGTRAKAFVTPKHLGKGFSEMGSTFTSFFKKHPEQSWFSVITDGFLEAWGLLIDAKLGILTLGVLPLLNVVNPYRFQPFASETVRSFFRGVKHSAAKLIR